MQQLLGKTKKQIPRFFTQTHGDPDWLGMTDCKAFARERDFVTPRSCSCRETFAAKATGSLRMPVYNLGDLIFGNSAYDLIGYLAALEDQ